ncbi:MAG: DNA integrity scanning protein DisA nucleotide-binding domain protein [Bacteroides sp.]|nr:MAG: DNA integrity scanning protein DisA nucleotide-binding domain protein [Bacteroides sp.]
MLYNNLIYKIRLLDIIDFLLVITIIIIFIRLIRGTIALNIMIGMSIILCFNLIVRVLKMKLMTNIFSQISNVGIIALIIVFQEEIRKFLLVIGRNFLNKKTIKWINFILPKKMSDINYDKIRPIIDSIRSMKISKSGMLMIFIPNINYSDSFNNGELIDSVLSKRLLESIFAKNSPLHDGAVIISNHRIIYASCILPLTSNTQIPLNFGLRHRAAIGISEVINSFALVLSEESGQISYAQDGKLYSNISLLELRTLLKREFSK